MTLKKTHSRVPCLIWEFWTIFLTVFSTNFFEWSNLCTLGTKPQVVTFLVSFHRPYTETGHLDGTDGNLLEDSLESSEQRLFWHEDSKPGTLVWTAGGPLDQALRSHTSVPCKMCSSSWKAVGFRNLKASEVERRTPLAPEVNHTLDCTKPLNDIPPFQVQMLT